MLDQVHFSSPSPIRNEPYPGESALFLLPKLDIIATFTLNYDRKLSILDYSLPIAARPTHFYGKSAENGTLVLEFWAQQPNIIGGTYPYRQRAMYPHQRAIGTKTSIK